MYLSNKYTKWYNSIVSNAQRRIWTAGMYGEKHHIIPRSLKGTNDLTNLVLLTGREHFICHWLLTKMVEGSAKQKMMYALWRMCNTDQHQHKVTSTTYAAARTAFVTARLGVKHTQETKRKIGDALRGKPKPCSPWNAGLRGYSIHTEEYKQWLRDAYTCSREQRYGAERATEITDKLRQRMAGKSHDEIYGDRSTELKAARSAKLKGKTLEEILGVEGAARSRERRRLARLKK